MLGTKTPKTRFAPSPTGRLHLGHLLSIIYVYGWAQVLKAKVLIRLEDHDLGRVREEYIQDLLFDLEWLGIKDQSSGMVQQSQHFERYEAILLKEQDDARLFGCDCSRKRLQADQKVAPLESAGELWYRGHCQARGLRKNKALRWLMPNEDISFEDARLGVQVQNPWRQAGAVLLRNRADEYTYQFAVSVDDWAEEIDLVIRGEDLLSSTARQMVLGRQWGRLSPPVFLHHPLITDPDGQKLAKSKLAKPLKQWREEGKAAEELFQMAARLGGLKPIAVSAEELWRYFDE